MARTESVKSASSGPAPAMWSITRKPICQDRPRSSILEVTVRTRPRTTASPVCVRSRTARASPCGLSLGSCGNPSAVEARPHRRIPSSRMACSVRGRGRRPDCVRPGWSPAARCDEGMTASVRRSNANPVLAFRTDAPLGRHGPGSIPGTWAPVHVRAAEVVWYDARMKRVLVAVSLAAGALSAGGMVAVAAPPKAGQAKCHGRRAHRQLTLQSHGQRLCIGACPDAEVTATYNKLNGLFDRVRYAPQLAKLQPGVDMQQLEADRDNRAITSSAGFTAFNSSLADGNTTFGALHLEYT